jgi:hypothetical protein
VRLTLAQGGTTTVQEQPLEVVADPRLEAPVTAIAARDSVADLLASRIDEIHRAVVRLRDVKSQVQGYVSRAGATSAPDTIARAGRTLAARLDAMDPRLTTKASNGQDIINYANGINGQYGFLLGQVEGNPELTQPVKERLVELEAIWQAIRAEVEQIESVDVPAFNALLKANNVPGVVSPAKPKGPIA